jgi:hypothetical protein
MRPIATNLVTEMQCWPILGHYGRAAMGQILTPHNSDNESWQSPSRVAYTQLAPPHRFIAEFDDSLTSGLH